ncbi:DUF342 domain-containing protein [Alteribacillus sp. JSM 102045]|uniref:DUF342 domain-containing protein n=1 Tax=Alteribacillus sp. JSM 102045 TaxID=1562101 RepID=UPI0035C1B3D7
MMRVQDFFKVRISEDKLSAAVMVAAPLKEDTIWPREEWEVFLKEEGVTFGQIEENIEALVNDPASVDFPLEIARGIPAKDGAPAYIKPALQRENTPINESNGTVNLKNVFNIPMVEQGDLVGVKAAAEKGTYGRTVDNEKVSAKDGHDFVLRPGKNTRIKGSSIYAVSSGQVSVQKKTIHVYPLYEINGDLDMKTGNIDFTGNVKVRGNIPAGFEVKAKGDINVQGTVEGATLEAEGSIFIAAGVTAQNKGYIKAGKDVETTYLNEAKVQAGGSITVKQAIMHSDCEAGGSIYCNQSKGQVIGGKISAVTSIEVKEAGNVMNTPTSFFIGLPHNLLKKQREYESTLIEAKEESQKINQLIKALEKKEEHEESLSPKETVMKLRARNTLKAWKEKAKDAAEELEEMQGVLQQENNGKVVIEDKLHPNVDCHFGKYRRKINTTYSSINILFEAGEIILR